MDFWPEFMASSWGKEFVGGGFGGIAGIVSGYPLDTLRIRQQQSANSGSALSILRRMVAVEGPTSLYRGMAAPLASVTFQNAMVFQIYAILSRSFDTSIPLEDPPSYRGVALGGIGTGALQSLMLSPVELIKIRLQLQSKIHHSGHRGPISVAKTILRTEGLKGIYRGLTITVLRDAPAHGLYFWTYEYMREKLHPGCRKSGEESLRTMLVAGGLAGVASWVCCYPLDVIKTRLQGQSGNAENRTYKGIADCFRKSVREEGYEVLWRGLGTAVARAFVVNGAIFAAYEIALRCLFNGTDNHSRDAVVGERVDDSIVSQAKEE
ncbi:PREDICTED: mitochondrial arginine transporter BAC2 [Tarenaya hassleriana]|uniref:mitochondrial arginine transporter BAC2 n=1 Tax=Tarenaya hassleriana TaxID=28532 RepID=UPI00053C9055|nr:PREDICTED: mitochondrial arginine transporter BAC2 [Tarenaya hassleriana]